MSKTIRSLTRAAGGPLNEAFLAILLKAKSDVLLETGGVRTSCIVRYHHQAKETELKSPHRSGGFLSPSANRLIRF